MRVCQAFSSVSCLILGSLQTFFWVFYHFNKLMSGGVQCFSSCQSTIVASVCRLCNSDTQSKCWSQTHQPETILVLLSFQVAPRFPPGLKFSSCPAGLPPLWSAPFWTGWECSWSAPLSRSSWWVPAPLPGALGSSSHGRGGRAAEVTVLCHSTVLWAPALPRPLLQPWFAQDTHCDWNVCQRSKEKEFLIKFKML